MPVVDYDCHKRKVSRVERIFWMFFRRVEKQMRFRIRHSYINVDFLAHSFTNRKSIRAWRTRPLKLS